MDRPVVQRRLRAAYLYTASLVAMLPLGSFEAAASDGKPVSARCSLERRAETATLSITARDGSFRLERTVTFGAHEIAQRFRLRRGRTTLVDARVQVDDAGRTTAMRLRYARALQKVRLLALRTDGQMLKGKLDGRAFAAVPLSQVSSLEVLRFRNGKPVGSIGAYRPAIAVALERLMAAAESLQTCSADGAEIPIVPLFSVGSIVSWGAKKLGASDCTACKLGCGVDGFACGIGAGALAAASAGPGALAIAACVYETYNCLDDCGCDVALCELVGGDGYFACDDVCCPPASTCNHAGNGVCCPSEQVVTPDGQCCMPDRTCGNTCCADAGAACNETSGQCCAQEKPPCGAGCCRSGLCTPGGTCCPDSPLTVLCGNTCCSTLSPCFPEISLCGPVGGTKCGFGQFCEVGETCIGTLCCPDGRACGNTCCPANQRCADPNSETCAQCPALIPNPVSCPADGTICCPANSTGNPAWICCGGGCCQNCCQGVCYPVGQATPCTPQ
jgi:hypothetical protein